MEGNEYISLAYALFHSVIYMIYWYTHNQKERCEYERLHADIQIQGEGDAEVVRIGEQLPSQSGPLFADFADLLVVGAQYLCAVKEARDVCVSH